MCYRHATKLLLAVFRLKLTNHKISIEFHNCEVVDPCKFPYFRVSAVFKTYLIDVPGFRKIILKKFDNSKRNILIEQ